MEIGFGFDWHRMEQPASWDANPAAERGKRTRIDLVQCNTITYDIKLQGLFSHSEVQCLGGFLSRHSHSNVGGAIQQTEYDCDMHIVYEFVKGGEALGEHIHSDLDWLCTVRWPQKCWAQVGLEGEWHEVRREREGGHPCKGKPYASDCLRWSFYPIVLSQSSGKWQLRGHPCLVPLPRQWWAVHKCRDPGWCTQKPHPSNTCLTETKKRVSGEEDVVPLNVVTSFFRIRRNHCLSMRVSGGSAQGIEQMLYITEWLSQTKPVWWLDVMEVWIISRWNPEAVAKVLKLVGR